MTLAAIFPGQGSQCLGMGHALYQQFPYIKPWFQEAEEVFQLPLRTLMFEGPEDALKPTHIAQPALFVLSMACMEVMRHEGIEPGFAYAAGHSLGEYSAFCGFGVLSFSQTLSLIRLRCESMARAMPGGMLAILGLSMHQVESFLQENCDIANDNTPQQVVVSGDLEGLHAMKERAEAHGARRCVILNVSGPFHSRLMADAQKVLSDAVKDLSFHEPKIPILTNVSALPKTDPLLLKQDLVQQITGRVLWRSTQQTLQALGVSELLEIGSGRVLCGLAKQTIPNVSCTSLATPEALWAWHESHLG